MSDLQQQAIVASVKAGIQNINEIIDVLNHPIAEKGDLIDLDYSPESVKTFRVRSAECDHNFEAASATATAWFTSVGNELQAATNRIGQVTADIHDTDTKLAVNQQLVAANIQAIVGLTQNLEHEQQLLKEAQDRLNQANDSLNSARAERDRVETARNVLIWFPLAAIALTVVDITKEENDVNSASSVVNAESDQLRKDQQLLQTHATELQKEKQEGLALTANITSLHATEAKLQAEETILKQQLDTLQPLRVSIDHCIHIVSGALGSASNIDNLSSMKNVGEGIKGVVAALKNEGDFTGALASLNDQGFVDLDKRIQALQKASKRLGNLGV